MREPTSEECSANAPYECNGRKGFAAWYPQMGGYVGRCVVLTDRRGTLGPGGNPADCFDVIIWHDGAFPLTEGDERAPAHLHHCDPEQFIAFGTLVRDAFAKAWLRDNAASVTVPEHPAVALLRRLEWSGEDNVCPACGGWGAHDTKDGHAPASHGERCELAALLAASKPGERALADLLAEDGPEAVEGEGPLWTARERALRDALEGCTIHVGPRVATVVMPDGESVANGGLLYADESLETRLAEAREAGRLEVRAEVEQHGVISRKDAAAAQARAVEAALQDAGVVEARNIREQLPTLLEEARAKGAEEEREACALEVEKEYATCDTSGATARQHIKWAAKHIRARGAPEKMPGAVPAWCARNPGGHRWTDAGTCAFCEVRR
jgi:hypothetical protein